MTKRTRDEVMASIAAKQEELADLTRKLTASLALDDLFPDFFTGDRPATTFWVDFTFHAIDSHGKEYTLAAMNVPRSLWHPEVVAAYNAASTFKRRVLQRRADREKADGQADAADEVSPLVADSDEGR